MIEKTNSPTKVQGKRRNLFMIHRQINDKKEEIEESVNCQKSVFKLSSILSADLTSKSKDELTALRISLEDISKSIIALAENHSVADTSKNNASNFLLLKLLLNIQEALFELNKLT